MSGGTQAEAPRAEETTDGDVVVSPKWPNYLGFWLAHLFVLGYCGVILAAMGTQFIGGELPCPLCMLQRMAMVLAAIGPLWIIGRAHKGRLTMTRYTCAYGLSILAACFGALISIRQILLHIVPPDPGYGDEVLGLHLYTWALVTFFIVIVYSGFMMIFSRSTYPVLPSGKAWRVVSRIVVVIFVVVVAANMVSVFFEEGFNLYLPDNPTGYELLD